MGTEHLCPRSLTRHAQRPKQSLPSHELMPAGRIIVFFFYLINLSQLYISSCEIAASSSAEWLLIHRFQTVSSGVSRAGLRCGHAPPLSPPSVWAKSREQMGKRCMRPECHCCRTFCCGLQQDLNVKNEIKASRLSSSCYNPRVDRELIEFQITLIQYFLL